MRGRVVANDGNHVIAKLINKCLGEPALAQVAMKLQQFVLHPQQANAKIHLLVMRRFILRDMKIGYK